MLYPKAGRHPDFPAQHWLVGDALDRGDEDYLRRFADELADEIEAANPQAVLLSTETLARKDIGAEHYERMARLFPKADLEWVLLFRNPISLAKSRYSEHVRQGLLRYPATLADIVSEPYLGQLGRMRALAQAAPTASIRVASFDQIKDRLVENFLAMLGYEEAFDADWKDISTHESLPEGATELSRYVNTLPERFARPLRLALTRLAWRHSRWFPTMRADTGRLERMIAPFQADCRAIERLFFDGQETGLLPKGFVEHNVKPLVAANAAVASQVSAYQPPNADGVVRVA